ncbi:hypothetical protein KGV31_002150 [Vibrio parahaemolyticus]|nr:hypothetical protein [Vibrio parahaemolyticus]EHU0344293.1 hypothetical protein [Vibrio parahaemolyticus]EHU0354327.1 hypothetical protein [Vibrio parahaemolyticus]
MYKSKHFKTEELVSKTMFNQRGSKAIELIDERVLITLDALRENLNKPITANNWLWGGSFQQRGLRDRAFYKSDAEYVASLSQHKYGRAVDFDVKGLSAKDVIKHIVDNKHLYPHVGFIEVDCNWVHVDVRNSELTLWSPKRGFINESEL